MLIVIWGLNLSAINPFKCYSIAAKGVNCEWTGWKYCNIDGYVDSENKLIYINSSVIQKFKYGVINKDVVDGVLVYSCDVIDSNNKRAHMTFFINIGGLDILHFKYADGEYMYMVDKLHFK